MDKAILLAVAASVCTATASLCQRKGAKDNETAGFDVRLLVRLARRPAWLLGIAAMMAGFVFQITALRFGDLALVQPILAAELLFVFGYLAIAGTRRVTGRSRPLVSPRIKRIGATSSSSMCWIMCMTISWSPSESRGETSAARITSRPPNNRARRPYPGG